MLPCGHPKHLIAASGRAAVVTQPRLARAALSRLFHWGRCPWLDPDLYNRPAAETGGVLSFVL